MATTQTTQPRTTAARKIRVMISSRCNDRVTLGGAERTFSDLRRELKRRLEDERLFGRPLFEVYINEDEGAEGGARPTWDHCLEQVRGADIVLVLYNGSSGWVEQGDIGICHAELMEALSKSPDKVRLVAITPGEAAAGAAGARDRRFRKYVADQQLLQETAGTGDDLIPLALKATHKAVLDMVRLGVREAHRGRFYTGEPLKWSQLDFEQRRRRMIKVVCEDLAGRDGAAREGRRVSVPLGGQSVLFLCHAVPAAMGIAAAREMSAQPFLDDYKYDDELGAEHVGPVHVIACHRNVTESQAITQLGFPDATVVSPPFGVYVADNVQKIQLVFIANCRDETTTRHGVQRFFDWLKKSGQRAALVRRAGARRNIVRAIAAEV